MENTFLKYKYLGNVMPSIPKVWEPIVLKMLIDIDVIVRPWYIPKFIMNYMVGKKRKPISVDLFHKIIDSRIDFLLQDVYISQIKQKFASLRVLGTFSTQIQKIVTDTEMLCKNTCEICGKSDTSFVTVKSWVKNLCTQCKKEAKQ
ncbi:MAG: hypothetical protein ACOH2V_01000 [Candidatus Saccharimonadaceae bacterium]